MTRRAAARTHRRWLVPEVVQTSNMDCGPATLKCMLEGHGIPVSYGRLREACQTDVDGTSIDTIEEVANQLGLQAEQALIPAEHLLAGRQLPAIVVVRRGDGATHFVVVWRRVGRWLQLMDPAIGRRWVSVTRFQEDLFRHELSLPADGWRAWTATEEFLVPMRARLAALGASARAGQALLDLALADPRWFRMAALDASVRLVQSVLDGGGVPRGRQAVGLLNALFRRTIDNPDDIYTLIARAYWGVAPDPDLADRTEQHLLVRGVIVLRVTGADQATAGSGDRDDSRPPPSRELRAALTEPPVRPIRELWLLLRADGIASPLALCGAVLIALGGVLTETLLFRGIFDISSVLSLPAQRVGAVALLLAFVALVWLIQFPIATETMRLGRKIDTRLRMAILAKLPRLNDRYFQSRPVSDMADRSHGIHLTRQLPGLGLHFMQANVELVLLVCGVAWIDAASVPWALALAGAGVLLPMAAQPLLNERDLRTRNHAGAMTSSYLDALLGLTAVRSHRAERSMRRQHEGLLVEWARSARAMVRLSIAADGLQSLVCVLLSSVLLIQHFTRLGGISGADLLLVYWTMKLPAVGGQLASIAHQYPSQRNILLRLIEPLTAPDERTAAANAAALQSALARGGAVDQSPPAAQPVPATGPLDRLTEVSAGSPADASAEPSAAPSARQAAATATAALLASAARPVTPPQRGVRIELQDARVLAAGHQILDRIGLTIRPGEHVAIVGPSGAGKSSLLGVLLGWHSLAQGQLLVDGVAVTGDNIADLRRVCAWVDPGIQIWNRSFQDNLNYACVDDGLARMGRVIQVADLGSVLRKLPAGLQSHLGEGGALLSGGEGQRVRLARALAQTDVRLALLDEPFRGMQRDQRNTLLAETRIWWHGVTLLCVTHDVQETLAFDRVLVVDDGRIVEDGPPRQLAATDSAYRALLDTEKQVHEQLWGDAGWRRLSVSDGRVIESPRPHNGQQAASAGHDVGAIADPAGDAARASGRPPPVRLSGGRGMPSS